MDKIFLFNRCHHGHYSSCIWCIRWNAKYNKPIDAYLDIEGILEIAKNAGVDAIHPGYGFLSENARFSSICNQYGIKFIGATAEQIEQMGDKASAKDTMKRAGVPTIPGSDGLVSDVKEGITIANEIGYEDIKYFNRLFKKWTGQTPSEYRANPEFCPSMDWSISPM